ncbi:MAG: Ada metal-binding domain-containing protein [bacterium]
MLSRLTSGFERKNREERGGYASYTSAMKFTRAQMLRASRRRDARYDGHFLTGVLSTGIYCLPSCPARNPKAENIRFFEQEDAAREAGLRPCKRCRPDLFYRDLDPEETLAADIAALIRKNVTGIPDVRDLARRSGVGQTTLNRLTLRHFHRTPSAMLTQARVDHVMRDLAVNGRGILETALNGGFESPSTFHAAFLRWGALRPGDVRKLIRNSETLLLPPRNFRFDLARKQILRDSKSPDQHSVGNRLLQAITLERGTATLELELNDRITLRIHADRKLHPNETIQAHRTALRILGLVVDPRPFEKRALSNDSGRILLGTRRGLRIPQTLDFWDGLVWVVVGQAVSLAAARAVRGRLIERYGEKAPGGLAALPAAARIADAGEKNLASVGLSASKAHTLRSLAEAVAGGELDAETLSTTSAPRIERILLQRSGLGPWSVHYLLMRSFALTDSVPVGDSALGEALKRFHQLERRPSPRETHKLLAPFAPYRSFAVMHHWMSLGDTP